MPRALTCADGGALEDHTVVDEADVVGGLRSARPLAAQQVEDARRQHRVLAVLDELAQVRQPHLLRLAVLLQDADDRVDDCLLVVEAALRKPRARRQRWREGQAGGRTEAKQPCGAACGIRRRRRGGRRGGQMA